MATTRRAAPGLAFVLHHYDWSETSLILDLFTRDAGRVAVAAKGAKRPYSQLRSVLLPFQRIAVSLGRLPQQEGAEVQTLRSAEYAGGSVPLGGAALLPGFYLNELLMKLLARHDPHPQLFDAYADTLAALAVADDAGSDAALRAFELVLLQETGVLPELDRDTATQQAVQPARRYVLRAEAGLVDAPADDLALPGERWQAIQAALDSRMGTALRAACAPARAALKAQLRALLHYHLGSPTLRTRQVMLDLHRVLDGR